MSFKRNVVNSLVSLSVMMLVACSAATAQSEDPVVWALSARHMTARAQELEQLAGGRDALVAQLLELRTKERPPFVGIRAQKLLLQYADRGDVQSALEQDVQSEHYKGLARVIAVNIDKVSQASFRRHLAKLAVDRALRDEDFTVYGKALVGSTDSEVRKLASDALGK